MNVNVLPQPLQDVILNWKNTEPFVETKQYKILTSYLSPGEFFLIFIMAKRINFSDIPKLCNEFKQDYYDVIQSISLLTKKELNGNINYQTYADTLAVKLLKLDDDFYNYFREIDKYINFIGNI